MIAPDLVPPSSPTITPFAGANSPAAIAGTWPEGDAVFLAITAHGRSYIYGSDPTLTSDGHGNWRLALAEELPGGVFDIAVIVSDASGNRSSDLTRDEIQVKGKPATQPAPAPVVAASPQPAPAQSAPAPTPAAPAQPVAAQPAPAASTQAAQAAPPQPATAVPAQPAPTQSAQPATQQSAALQATAAPQAEPAALQQASQPPTPAPPAAPQQPEVAALAEPPFEAETDPSVNRKCQRAINAAMSGHYIFFLSDGDTIAPESVDLLKRVAKAAQQCPRSPIEIGGHTDATGSPTHNLELSERRAGSVLEALVGSGVKRARLSAVGYGEQKPTTTNKTPEGRATNRRIEFVVAQ